MSKFLITSNHNQLGSVIENLKIADLQLLKLCPLHSSLAFCLNQLRSAHIHFLNLGNLIICAEHNCLFIFKSKTLIRMESLTTQH